MLSPRMRRLAVVVLFNAVLAAAVQALAPAQPRLTDRDEYEYSGRQPLALNCPNTIYCYRILVPVLLDQIPADSERRWRGLQWLAHTATGSIVAMATAPMGPPLIASILLQTSYAFTFTAYDPYSADPVVFLISALVLYQWLADRALAVAVIATIGVFAKETVALIATVPAIAAMLSDRQTRWRWATSAVIAWFVLLSFHWYMDTYSGWGISRNPAASFSTGSWLAIWWKMNPSLAKKALMLFAPFGFAWAFSALGYRHASRPFQQLAAGAALPMLALTFVQTPERALGNAFFVVIPLATVFLSRISPAAAWAAAVTNGLVTAKIGLSTEWLPSTSMLLIPATLCSAWAVASSRRGFRISS
jgi:hypothetical protein